MNEYILEMRNITKDFPGVRALDNVSFSARKGEILALVGENGAGKSTLMKVLNGAFAFDSYAGEICVDGKVQKFMNTADSEAAGISMIYQEVNLHFPLSIAENLAIGQWPMKNKCTVDWKKMYADARKKLEAVGLNVDVKKQARSLSISQMQMVAIAKEIAKNPKILILDEPTSALTGAETKTLFDLLLEFRKRGMCIILITHKMEEVFTYADRVVVLRDGQTISTYEKNAISEDRVIADMVGRKMDNYYPERHNVPGEVVFVAKDYTIPHPMHPERNILENFSFELRRGEILGFAGLVGAGRSELVNAIFGKTGCRSGECYLEGKKLNIREPIDAVREGIGLITENRKVDGFVGPSSIKRNICLASLDKVSKGLHVSAQKEKEYAEKYFKALEIKAPSIETFVEQLSGGNQQKVIVAKWMMSDPKILIMDEPTKGIDVAAKRAIYDLMTEFAQQGVSIIMISSELPELMAMSDRVIVFADGKKAAELTGEDINDHTIVYYETSANESIA